MKLRDIDRHIREADHERCQNTTVKNYQTILRWKAIARTYRNIPGEISLTVTDVGGRVPKSKHANPYWHDFGCECWNRDIVLKSDSEPPTRSEVSAKNRVLHSETDVVMVVFHLHRVVMAG